MTVLLLVAETIKSVKTFHKKNLVSKTIIDVSLISQHLLYLLHGFKNENKDVLIS